MWVVLPWQPPLGGQVMLKRRSWRRGRRSKKKKRRRKCTFMCLTARKGDVGRSSDDERGTATAAALCSLSASSPPLPSSPICFVTRGELVPEVLAVAVYSAVCRVPHYCEQQARDAAEGDSLTPRPGERSSKGASVS